MSFRVIVAASAERQSWLISDWWLLNRPKAPRLFEEEFAWGLTFLETAPYAGARVTNNSVGVRRLLLRKSRYHLYYRINEPARLVEVLAIWHASQADGPPL